MRLREVIPDCYPLGSRYGAARATASEPDFMCRLPTLCAGGALCARPPTTLSLSRLQDVPRPPDRVNQLDLAFAVDDAAEAADVDLDQVREGIEIVVPDVLGDLFAAHDPAGIYREIFEQRVLLGGQGQLVAAARDAMRARIEAKVADLDDRILPHSAPTQESAQAGQQLRELERLDEIVIGAGVESFDAVGHRVAG